jgi:hypothetical protein
MTPVYTHHRFLSSLVVPWLTALLICSIAAPALVSAQGAVDVYRSPRFGYLFWWDADQWSVQGESSDPGLDWIQLANQTTAVDVWGYEAPGATPESCLAERLDQITGDPTLTRLEEREHDEAVRAVYWGGGDAVNELLLGFAGEDGEYLVVARERCSAIVPGQLFLVTSEWTLAETFNASVAAGYSDGYGTDGIMATLTLPGAAWTFDPSSGRAAGPLEAFDPPRAQIFGLDGAELGVVTLHEFYCLQSSPAFGVLDRETAVFENTGFADLLLAPDAFVTADPNGNIVGPAFHRWLQPALASDQSVVLAPGEVAILQLEATGIYPNEVYFIDPSGNGLYLFAPLGCQGGAAAPIAIDMD